MRTNISSMLALKAAGSKPGAAPPSARAATAAHAAGAPETGDELPPTDAGGSAPQAPLSTALAEAMRLANTPASPATTIESLRRPRAANGAGATDAVATPAAAADTAAFAKALITALGASHGEPAAGAASNTPTPTPSDTTSAADTAESASAAAPWFAPAWLQRQSTPSAPALPASTTGEASASTLARASATTASTPALPAPSTGSAPVAGTAGSTTDPNATATLPSAGLGTGLSTALASAGVAGSTSHETSAPTPDMSIPTPAPDAATLGALSGLGSFTALHEAPAATVHALPSPVGSSAWNAELGNRIVWMANAGHGTASLQLQPASLGPIEVRLSVHAGQASVWFSATEPQTRTSIEQALPTLRDMLSNNGLTLADAGVHREPPRQSNPSPALQSNGLAASAAESAAPMLVAPSTALLDTYA